jgi:hypothetical protein
MVKNGSEEGFTGGNEIVSQEKFREKITLKQRCKSGRIK